MEALACKNPLILTLSEAVILILTYQKGAAGQERWSP